MEENRECRCSLVRDRDCCNKSKLVMELVKKTLFYDIENTAYLYAKALRAEGVDDELKSDICDICQGGNADITARFADEAVALCRAMLTRFLDDGVSGGYFTNIIEECIGHPMNDNDIYIIVSVPATYGKANADALFHAVMHYIVNKTIASYLAVVYPDGAETFLAKANAYEQEIDSLTRRTRAGTVRITPHWF